MDLRKEIEHTAEELAYAAVGFAVLGFQRAQVARRQLGRCDPVTVLTDPLTRLAEQVRQVFSAAGGTGDDES